MDSVNSQEVTTSGTVGKQVFAAGATPKAVTLGGFLLTASGTSAGSVTIRDGNASGEVKYIARAVLNTSRPVETGCHRFDKGMHVKVLGGATCYLMIA